MKERKYLPFTIAKSFKNDYVKHCVADFETCRTEDGTDVRVWAWGLADILTYDFTYNNSIETFLDKVLEDTIVYDIGFHNLKFDGQYILPAIYKRGYEYIPNSEFMDLWSKGHDMSKKFTHNITAQGQWFSIIIVKDKINATSSTPAFVHIWDTYKLFPQSLKETGKQYCKTYQKIDEPKEFYKVIRPVGHELTDEELMYLKYDCLTLAEALNKQYEMFGTIYRTRAAKAFDFFKSCCIIPETGKNNYQNKYEGLRQFRIPKVEGFEDWEGVYYRFTPKEIRDKLAAKKVKLIKDFEYHIKDYDTWSDFKQAYRGGISYVNPNIKEKDVIGNITVLDVNSMYPYCLRNYPIPYGKFTKRKGKPVDHEGGTWIACARVSFRLKNEWNLPCIQIKHLYGREWLRESTDYKEYDCMDYYNDDIIWFTKVDYETYLENYDFDVHEWICWYDFRMTSNIDGQRFIDKYYKQKQDAEQKRNKRMEELDYDPARYKEDDEYLVACMERQEAKIIMNSAYGKHGTKYVLLSKNTSYLGEDMPIQFEGEKFSFNKEPDDPSHYYIPYACFVTAYARRMLVRAWNSFKGKALYCDTDSVHIYGTPDDIPPELAEYVDWLKTGELGKWKEEGRFVAARYIRSKTYIEVDKNGKCTIACAGATPEIKELMTFDNFKVGFNAWDICAREGKDPNYHCKLAPKQYPSGVDLEPLNFEIRSLN